MRALALSGLVVSAFLVGCTETVPPDPPTPAPPFPEGTGQEAKPEVVYPEGPFGVSIGSIIQNFQYEGFVNAFEIQNDALETVQLADFYNPTGSDVYPDGSPFGAGTPKPKALLIDVASVWCGPCNAEAKDVLPGLYAQYQPAGGQFLLNLADGPTPGIPAKQNHLRNWTNKYDVNFPAVIDPNYRMMDLAVQDAFPQNFLIDTTTMEIVEVIAGVPDASFWNKYENLIGL